jgi:hypothetical protein
VVRVVIEQLTQCSILRALYAYWDRQRQGRAMPGRSDIDPAGLPAGVLPSLAMFDLIEHARRIRVRLLGTDLVTRFGRDFTGRYLDEIMNGDYLDYLAGLCREVHARRAPLYTENMFRWQVRQDIVTRRLLLPLANGADEPAILLAGITFDAADERLDEPMQFNGMTQRTELKRHIFDVQTA